MDNETEEDVRAWLLYAPKEHSGIIGATALTQAQRIEAQRKASEINRKELEQYRKSKAGKVE